MVVDCSWNDHHLNDDFSSLKTEFENTVFK